ncbi:4863_t:CDS:2 [Gigaspora margarita]|uniref:4863_t:CDS:1 n=1 Tax=Gigaspora margarita TaxID=4874 RepID=A0ABN7UEP2_GIGMA|nr:4863_t:CDS:2 [Gigaspora margarita]
MFFTSLCNNFIDLTTASNESSSDLEISEIDIDTDESDTITKTYNFFTKKLCINEIQYSPIPIEYPPTSLEGTAIIYNISGWNDYNTAFSDVQYNMGDIGGKKNYRCEFLGCKVNKSVRICTGAKVCEFVSSKSKETQHTEIDESIDFYKLNQPTDLQTSKEKKSDDDIQSYFIGCSAWSPGQRHFHYKLNCNEIDFIMLEELFKGKPVNLDEIEKNLAIQEKQLELEEHETELELRRVNIKKNEKNLNL